MQYMFYQMPTSVFSIQVLVLNTPAVVDKVCFRLHLNDGSTFTETFTWLKTSN